MTKKPKTTKSKTCSWRSIIKTTKFRELRVDISEYKGHDMIGLRQWVQPYSGDDDERIATKNGIAFRLKDLPAVIAALEEAEKEARRAGLFNAAEAAA